MAWPSKRFCEDFFTFIALPVKTLFDYFRRKASSAQQWDNTEPFRETSGSQLKNGSVGFGKQLI